MFSRRASLEDEPNDVAVALAQQRESGRDVLDLTVSNPTTAGLPFDARTLLAAFNDTRALRYQPDAFGLRSARESVAEWYRQRGVDVEPERIALTASTSEAYGHLFKLLCDPGDEILVPAPSYPLFDQLAQFESVTLVPYPLRYDGAWHTDLADLRTRVTPKTKALIVVHPNNPTGSYLKADELAALDTLGLPLIADEVFESYPLRADATRVTTTIGSGSALRFSLSGLSKVAALPQMKLAWIVFSGDEKLVAEARRRLDGLLDASLAVGTPVQVALPELLRGSAVTREAIVARLAQNLAIAHEVFRDTAVTVLDVEGGWYVTLRLPALKSELEWTIELLNQRHVYTHPGSFFRFATEPYVVVSLLTSPDVFHEGCTRIAAHLRPHR